MQRTLSQRGAGRAIVIGFFLLLVITGFAIHRDYGVTYDEPRLYEYGELVADFYKNGSREFEGFVNLRYYGPFIPLLLHRLTEALDPSDQDLYPMGHLVNFFIFAFGVACFYVLCLIQFRSWGWALFGSAMLVLSPRIFSHGFVNLKDGPFLSLFVANILLLVLYLEKRKLYLLALMGVATGLLIDVRVLGGIVGVFALAAMIADPQGRQWKKLVSHFAMYASVAGAIAIALWPFLWPDPVGRLIETIRVMGDFREGAQVVVYLGQVVRTTEMPWHYLPVWIAISTPIAYLALFVFGAVRLAVQHPLQLFRTRSIDRHFYLYGLWVLLVPLAAIVRGAPLYDEWRQVNFIYPGMLLFAVWGARWIYSFLEPRLAAARSALAFLLVASLAWSGVIMVRLHPYQAMYFNALAGGLDGAEKRFELDYWGLSYKDGIEYLLKENPGRRLEVRTCTFPALPNAELFSDGDRINFATANPEFFICAPREWMLRPYNRDEMFSQFVTVYTVSRNGGTFLWVKDMTRTTEGT